MKKKWLLLPLMGVMLPLVMMSFLLFSSAAGGGSEGTTGVGTSLTAKEVASKTDISEERAKDVIKILNWLMGKEESTLEGATGVLAVAERESGFDPAAINTGGGVAGYFQWSGWSNQVNGNRWALARERKLDPDVELDLMSKELNGNWKKVKDYLKTAKSPEEAALYWSEHYEGVSLSDGQTKAETLKKNAQKWQEVFKGTVSNQGKKSSKKKKGKVKGNAQVASGQISSEIPAGFTLDKPMNTSGFIASSYPYGQCTWFVYNRAKEFGVSFSPYMGNGGDWKSQSGYEVTNTPTKHAAVSFYPGQAGADFTYGHVSFVEDVAADGSVLISESNVSGLGVVTYRVFDSESAKKLTYVIGHK